MTRRLKLALAAVTLTATAALCQSTQGRISGTVRHPDSLTPPGAAYVYFCRISPAGAVTETGWVPADKLGRFTLPSLTAGEYRLRAQWAEQEQNPPPGVCFPPPPGNPVFQAQEKHDLLLGVGARMEVDFDLRPSREVWDSQSASRLTSNKQMVVRYFGADARVMRSGAVDTAPASRQWSGPTVSYDLDPRALQRLPLAGRDAYGLLALLPGVTASTATGRGLGLSVNGQRPTASNYILDGAENNNFLLTGPLAALAPEMIQEYRVSTSSWSAEYGGSAGFLANAITASAVDRWHGVAYFNLKNDALNALNYRNVPGNRPQLPEEEAQFGAHSGGALIRHRLLFSAGFEHYRSRSLRPEEKFTVPAPGFVRSLLENSGPASVLFRRFPLPTADPGNGNTTTFKAHRSVSFDRSTALARADYLFGQNRLTLRAALNQFDWPDFAWYPYPDFTSGLTQPAANIALHLTSSFTPSFTQELHAAWSNSALRWDRAHPEIPSFSVGGDTLLPGSPLLYSFHNANHAGQFDGVWGWVARGHIVKFGGGIHHRHATVLSNQGENGLVTFNTLGNLFQDRPSTYAAALSRLEPRLELPSPGRTYRYRRLSFFGEDSWRINRRLVVNAGLRWEYFGAPVNIGPAKDVLVQLGSGASMPQQLAGAALVRPGAGDQPLYAAAKTGFSPRIGFAWQPAGDLVAVRGGYGIFFDRPFDNLFNVRNNATSLATSTPCTVNGVNLCLANPQGYLAPPGVLLAALDPPSPTNRFPPLVLLDPKLRNGYSQNFFLALRKQLAPSWDVEISGLGALGRRLLTTDIVNRALSTPDGAFNHTLPEILWRSNQGQSSYSALSTVARYRSRLGAAQVSYTWSHSIDNQSDALAGDFFDLSFANATTPSDTAPKAAFTEQFNSRGDRATSGFDQRHNLVFFSWWDLPGSSSRGPLSALTRNWRVSQIAAIRSGVPFTVRSAATGALKNQRADIVLPGAIWAPEAPPSPTGTVVFLNPAAFKAPPDGRVGNSGRNAFAGPGLWTLDLSVGRTFPARFLGESARLWLRADVFNAFNHANLNNPDSRVGSRTFGQATLGRQDYAAGFPALVPFRETPRLVQLIFKLEF